MLMASYTSSKDLQALLALRLHRSLNGINRGKDHTESRSSEGCEYRLHEGGHVLEIYVGLEERQNPGIGSGISKTGDRPLNESC